MPLRNAWLGVAFNVGGVGAAAKAVQLSKAAGGVVGATGRAGFVREARHLLRPQSVEAWADVQRLSALRQEMGAKGALVHLARMSKRQWDDMVPGAKGSTVIGLAIDVGSPLATDDGPLAHRRARALPREFVDLVVQDAGRADLRAKVPPGTPDYAEFTKRGSGPRPVMGS